RSAWPSAATAQAPGDGRRPTGRRSRARVDIGGFARRTWPSLAKRIGAVGMTTFTATLERIRLLAGAMAVALVLASALGAVAQPAPDPGPAPSAQQRNPDTSVNPTASSVKENELLQQLRIISGRGSIPDIKSYNIEQPAGRDWRQFHEVTIHWIGGI